MSDFLATLRQEVKEMLIKSMPEALRILKESLPEGSPKHDAILLVEARLHDAHQKKISNLLSYDDLTVLYDRIRHDLLLFTNSLRAEDFVLTKAVKTNKNGSLLYRIPHQMTIGQEERCVIRLAYDKETLVKDITVDSDTNIEAIRVSHIMHTALIDASGKEAFEIRTFNEKEQLVEAYDYTEWIFYVKPLKKGEFPLVLKISVVIEVDDKERLKNIVLEKKVNVSSRKGADTVPQTDFSTSDYYFASSYSAGTKNEVTTTTTIPPAKQAEPAKKAIKINPKNSASPKKPKIVISSNKAKSTKAKSIKIKKTKNSNSPPVAKRIPSPTQTGSLPRQGTQSYRPPSPPLNSPPKAKKSSNKARFRAFASVLIIIATVGLAWPYINGSKNTVTNSKNEQIRIEDSPNLGSPPSIPNDNSQASNKPQQRPPSTINNKPQTKKPIKDKDDILIIEPNDKVVLEKPDSNKLKKKGIKNNLTPEADLQQIMTAPASTNAKAEIKTIDLTSKQDSIRQDSLKKAKGN